MTLADTLGEPQSLPCTPLDKLSENSELQGGLNPATPCNKELEMQRMNTIAALLGAGTLCLGLSMQQVGQPPSQQLLSIDIARYDSASPPSDSEVDDLIVARLTGAPIPSTFTLAESHGYVDSMLTSLQNMNGERRCIVSVADETPDIVIARVFVNGILKTTATVANGKLTDLGNGYSEATLPFWLPASPPYEIEVSWENGLGQFVEHGIDIE